MNYFEPQTKRNNRDTHTSKWFIKRKIKKEKDDDDDDDKRAISNEESSYFNIYIFSMMIVYL